MAICQNMYFWLMTELAWSHKIKKPQNYDRIYLSVFQVGSPFREPLMKYLLRYPSQTVDFFVTDNNLRNAQFSRLFAVSTIPSSHRQAWESTWFDGKKYVFQVPDLLNYQLLNMKGIVYQLGVLHLDLDNVNGLSHSKYPDRENHWICHLCLNTTGTVRPIHYRACFSSWKFTHWDW